MSGRSKIAARVAASRSSGGPPNAAIVRAFCCSTQAVARAPSISSSQRYGSSSGAATVGRTSMVIGAYFTGSLTKATLLRPALEASASVSAT